MKKMMMTAMLILALPHVSFACGEEENQIAADGSVTLEAMNLDCQSSKEDGLKIEMRWSWGACLTSQKVTVTGNRQYISYAISYRGDRPREDHLRIIRAENGDLKMSFQSEDGSQPESKLALKRDPRNDRRAKVKNWRGDYEKLEAYVGVLNIEKRAVKVACRTTPQEH